MIHSWRTRRLIRAYHEGDLPRGQEEALRNHLTACADCREVLKKLQDTDALLMGARPVVTALPSQETRVVLARALAQAGVIPAPQRSWRGVWGVAAAVSIATLGTSAFVVPGERAAFDPLSDPVSTSAPSDVAPELSPLFAAEAPDEVLPVDGAVTPRTPARTVYRRRSRGTRISVARAAEPAEALAEDVPSAAPTSYEYVDAVPEMPQPRATLFFVVTDARDLGLESVQGGNEAAVRETGYAEASTSFRDACGRVTCQEVTVSSDDDTPTIVLTGQPDSVSGQPDNQGK
jgi:hypothetical protein